MITLTRPTNIPYYFVNGRLPQDVSDTLDMMMSDYTADYQNSPKFLNNEWDGKFHLFKESRNGNWYFPPGFIIEVCDVLDSFEIPYQVVDKTKHQSYPIKMQWNFKGALREYQAEALMNVMSAGGCGVVSLPTGSGKTLVALQYAYARGERFIILVHRKELVDQWAREIRNILGINPTIVGEGSGELSKGPCVIAMIQTLHRWIKDKKIDYISGFSLAVYDECFPYETKIKTNVGDIEIGEIVEKKLKVSVITHTGEFKPIIGYFKKETQEELLIIIHSSGDFECTVNHLILTQRGWISAEKLEMGDKLAFYGRNGREEVCVQSVRRVIRKTSPSSNTCFSKAQQINIGEKEGNTINCCKCSHEQQISYKIDRNARADDSWEFVGGYGNKESKSIQQQREDNRKTLFRTGRVCGLEVRNIEKYSDNSAKDRRERRLGRMRVSIQHPFDTMLKYIGRFGEAEWKEICIGRMVRKDKPPGGIVNLVFRRWNSKSPQNISESKREDISRLEECPRNRGNPRLVIGSVGVQCEDKCVGKRDGTFNAPKTRGIGFHRNNTTPCLQTHGIQDRTIVYDLEVEDNHSYTANGVVVHNCHILAADSVQKVAHSLSTKWSMGLSATPWRSDNLQLKIFGSVGPLMSDIKVEDLVDGGYLAAPRFYIFQAPSSVISRSEDWQTIYKTGIVKNEERNNIIAAAARKFQEENRTVFVSVTQIAHGRTIARLIPGSRFVSSATKTRSKDIEEFRNGKYNCLVSTLLREGSDIPAIDALIYASGMKSEVSTIQVIGRALRVKRDGGDAAIVDFHDSGHIFLAQHSNQRMNTYDRIYGKYFSPVGKLKGVV